MKLAKDLDLDELRQEVQELKDMAEIVLLLIPEHTDLVASLISYIECQSEYLVDGFCVRGK